MKRLFTMLAMVAVVSAVNFVGIAFVLSQLPAQAQDGTECVPGDINDDGLTDLGDAIFLLAYLYDDGPEPVVCAQEVEVEVPVQVWPPKPADLVYLASNVVLPEGEPEIIYEVPEDRWLVVTGLQSSQGISIQFDVEKHVGKEITLMRSWVLSRDVAGGYTSSGTGMLFDPGSEVVFASIGSGNTNVRYALTGYLVDAEEETP